MPTKIAFLKKLLYFCGIFFTVNFMRRTKKNSENEDLEDIKSLQNNKKFKNYVVD